MEADGLESRWGFVPSDWAIIDCPFSWYMPVPVALRGGAVMWGHFHPGHRVRAGFLVGRSCAVSWGRRLQHCVF